MRLIGALFIISGTTLIGFLISKIYITRVELLKDLQTALKMLETEISYGINPLPQAFANLEEDFVGELENFFAVAKKELLKGLTSEQAWLKAVDVLAARTVLLNEDVKILKDLAYNFGQTDIQQQLKYLELAHDKLATAIKKALEQRDKNVKLLRYSGFLIGLLIIILIL